MMEHLSALEHGVLLTGIEGCSSGEPGEAGQAYGHKLQA